MKIINNSGSQPKNNGIYACLFSDGTIKVGKGNDTEQRIASHKGAGKCFSIDLIESFSLACFLKDDGEKKLIAWCRSKSKTVYGREWFKGVDFGECKMQMRNIILSEMGPHIPTKAQVATAELIWKVKNVSREQAAYDEARRKVILVSNPGAEVIAAMDYIHRRCEAVRNAMQVGAIAPPWYEELNVFGAWEEELFFCNGVPDSDLLKALAASLDGVESSGE